MRGQVVQYSIDETHHRKTGPLACIITLNRNFR